MWMGGRSVVMRRAVGLATTKDIGEKRIVIGRDSGFFVVADSVSSLFSGQCAGVLGSRRKCGLLEY